MDINISSLFYIRTRDSEGNALNDGVIRAVHISTHSNLQTYLHVHIHVYIINYIQIFTHTHTSKGIYLLQHNHALFHQRPFLKW